MKSDRNTEYLLQFGKHLKQVREAKGLSQEKLANISDLSLSQVSRIERGIVSTSLSQLVSIARALDMTPAELLRF